MSYGKILVLDKSPQQAADTVEQDAPALQTVVVHHEECTECGDLETDSGAVKIPAKLRSQYVKANAKWYVASTNGSWGTTANKVDSLIAIRSQESKLKAMQYRLYTVKLESEKDFENLFLLPGKKPSNSYDSSDNPWDFNRRYRATVEAVGVQGRYLTVRVRKAVRLADRTN